MVDTGHTSLAVVDGRTRTLPRGPFWPTLTHAPDTATHPLTLVDQPRPALSQFSTPRTISRVGYNAVALCLRASVSRTRYVE